MNSMFIGVIAVAGIILAIMLGFNIYFEMIKQQETQRQPEKVEQQPEITFTLIESDDSESALGTNREKAVLYLIKYKGEDESGASVINSIFELRKILEPDLTSEQFRNNYDWAYSEDMHSEVHYIVMYYQNENFDDEYAFHVNLESMKVTGVNELGKTIIDFVNAENSDGRQITEEVQGEIDPEKFCQEDTQFFYQVLDMMDFYEEKYEEICSN